MLPPCLPCHILSFFLSISLSITLCFIQFFSLCLFPLILLSHHRRRHSLPPFLPFFLCRCTVHSSVPPPRIPLQMWVVLMTAQYPFGCLTLSSAWVQTTINTKSSSNKLSRKVPKPYIDLILKKDISLKILTKSIHCILAYLSLVDRCDLEWRFVLKRFKPLYSTWMCYWQWA